jgi:D-alanyl-D-alanine endopeptidase (penicillin-binding protein 7)
MGMDFHGGNGSVADSDYSRRSIHPSRWLLACGHILLGLALFALISPTNLAADPAGSPPASAQLSADNQPSPTLYAASTKNSKSTKRNIRLRYGSRAALVVDARTGKILFEKDSGRQRSIASLTKLMTAIIFLETDPDLSTKVKVARSDLSGSGRTQLRRNEKVRLRDLLYHSLMSSDNAATKTLVRISGISSQEFLKRMNRKASVLGLHQTRFVGFTGLNSGNVSSAADMAQLLRFSLNYPMIKRITSKPEYSYRSNVRAHRLVNTNRLLTYSKMDIRGGKTGYIRKAGWCLVTWVRYNGLDVITVVLGAPSNPARFAEAKQLLGKTVPQATSALPEPAAGSEIESHTGS